MHLAFILSKFFQDRDLTFDLTSADGDSRTAWVKTNYSSEPITPTNLSSSSPEREEEEKSQAQEEPKTAGESSLGQR